MNPEIFTYADRAAVDAYLADEEQAIESLLLLAKAAAEGHQAERAMYLRVTAKKRANEVLAIREWLDLR